MKTVTVVFPENSDHHGITKIVVEKVRTFLSWIGDMEALNNKSISVSIHKYESETISAFKELGCQVS